MATRSLSEQLSKSVCASTLYLCENSPGSLSVVPETISAADLPKTSLPAERAPGNTAGSVIVHGFGDSCAIIAALS